MSNTTQVSEPSILTANTYYWTSGASAAQRRKNETRNLKNVAEFFRSIGMKVTEGNDFVVGEKGGIWAKFSYAESCKNVYKSLSVQREGKNSNITTLRKLYAK